jgi:hypothetical protein
MVHSLLVLAVILAVLWVLFHAAGAVVHLLLVGAVILAVLWLLGFMRGRSSTV